MTTQPTQTIETNSVEQTLTLGSSLGEALQPGAVIALIGTLGSGKTHFAKGVARGAGVPSDTVVNSPTFVLINEYAGRIHLYHIDVYRLRGGSDLDALGFDEMIVSGGAVLVEWADRVEECLPPDHLRIEIDITGETARRFTIEAKGPMSLAMLARLS